MMTSTSKNGRTIGVVLAGHPEGCHRSQVAAERHMPGSLQLAQDIYY